MADLYGRAPSPASEPEEISTFIHQLLHNNPSTSSSKFVYRAFSSSPLPPPPETASAAELLDPRQLEPECRAGGSSVNISDPGGYFATEDVENAVSYFSSKRRGVSVDNGAGDFSCDSENGAELSVVPSDRARPRSSSKRSRTAEVHNLSEKRRRSRINEKMKALQNLIPNSNKTDKASMLDDAIEYLKQLQLQVQMLTMRNGLNLNSTCFPGALQPLQLPLTGLNFEEGNILSNTNAATGALSANEESSVHTSHNISSQCTISNLPIVIPFRTNINSQDTSFGFDSSTEVDHGPFSFSAASKRPVEKAHLEGN